MPTDFTDESDKPAGFNLSLLRYWGSLGLLFNGGFFDLSIIKKVVEIRTGLFPVKIRPYSFILATIVRTANNGSILIDTTVTGIL